MKQLSLAETGFLPKRGKVTRKAEFLAEMNTVVPWSRLEGLVIESHNSISAVITCSPLGGPWSLKHLASAGVGN